MTDIVERYTVTEHLESGHDCCFKAAVIDTHRVSPFKQICECHELEDAKAIADGLNIVHVLRTELTLTDDPHHLLHQLRRFKVDSDRLGAMIAGGRAS